MIVSNGGAAARHEAEMRALQDQITERNAMIQSLQTTTQELQATMQAMMGAMAASGLITAEHAAGILPSGGHGGQQVLDHQATETAAEDAGRVNESASMWAAAQPVYPQGNPNL